jgi:Uma2 family endonuclease
MNRAAQFSDSPRPVRFTRDQYFQMCETGLFNGMRVQLIGGEIVEMPAQGNKHGATIHRIHRLLEGLFGPGFWVRNQLTLDLSPHGVPDPDIAVVRGDPDQPSDNNPTTALLVVEVSDSMLSYDRNAKASLYATAGIADYWIVNIPDRQLEIRRAPQPDSTAEFGHSYGSLTTLKPGSTATPLAAASGVVPVDRLFF